jgi:hypothetical protein
MSVTTRSMMDRGLQNDVSSVPPPSSFTRRQLKFEVLAGFHQDGNIHYFVIGTTIIDLFL